MSAAERRAVGGSYFGTVRGAILISLNYGNVDGLGNHSIVTYYNVGDFKKDYPHLYRQLFGNN